MAFATLGIAIGLGCGARQDPPPPTPFEPANAPPVVDTALEKAIDAVADYIVRHTADNGRFTYVLDARGRSEPTDYNVLRHGGTIYALGELRAARGPSSSIDAAIARSARYLIERHVGSFEAPNGIGPRGSLAVWSRTGEEIRGERRQAKLGGAGLGLVALTTAFAIDNTSVSLELLRGLALSIGSMQKPDGHFVSKVIEGGGPDPSFISLYYPGEAVLGLARLYRLDPDERWIRIASRAISALVKMRSELEERELPADHWLLIAIAEIAQLEKDKPEIAELLSTTTEAMLKHAVRIADAMLAEQRRAGADGSFNPKRRSTPTATRLEGIFAILAVLPADHPARPRLITASRAAAQFLLTCRVKKGVEARLGGITRRCPPRKSGRSAEIRIDYAQHALSAFLGARALGL